MVNVKIVKVSSNHAFIFYLVRTMDSLTLTAHLLLTYTVHKLGHWQPFKD